jgi:hypothetical protein
MRLLDLGFSVPEEMICQPGALTNIDWLEKELQAKTRDQLSIEKYKFRVGKDPRELFLKKIAPGAPTFESSPSKRSPSAAAGGGGGAGAADVGEGLKRQPQSFIEFLENHLREHGPVITSISDPEVSGHWIIVDEVSRTDGTVRLRDPYHGRMIDVPIEAFMKRFNDPEDESNVAETMLWVRRR